jgi:hypothetical protein
VTAAATLLVAAAILLGLGLASAAVDDRAADVEAMQARLDGLSRRELPAPPPHVPTDALGSDSRLIAASSAGSAASSLQDMLSAYAADAGLSVARMTVETLSGGDQDRTAGLRLEATGTINALQAALFRIETGVPYLFVSELELQRQTGTDDDGLSIVATIRARWKDVTP